jgi:hypothetical protein
MRKFYFLFISVFLFSIFFALGTDREFISSKNRFHPDKKINARKVRLMGRSKINVRDRDEIPSFPRGGGDHWRKTGNSSVICEGGGGRQIIQLPPSIEEKDIESICHRVRERNTENPFVTKCGGERQRIHLSPSVGEKDRNSICHQVLEKRQRIHLSPSVGDKGRNPSVAKRGEKDRESICHQVTRRKTEIHLLPSVGRKTENQSVTKCGREIQRIHLSQVLGEI